MTAVQIFAHFLDEQEIRYEIRNEKTLSITYTGDNAPEIRVLFIFGDDGREVAIRCFSVAKVPDNKLAKAYELCSKLNDDWRWVKFFVDSDNEITAADDAVIEPNTLGEECFELLVRCVRIVDKAYPEIMAMVWGFNTGVSAPQKR